MPELSSLSEVASGIGVPALAALGLALVLAIAALRYRSLYRAALLERRYSSELVENLSEGIYRSTPDGRQLSANRALVRLNGYDTEAEMLCRVRDIATEWYVEPGRRDEFRAILKRDGKVCNFVSEIYRHKTRERVWISESARLVYSKSGRPLFYEGSVREITETVARLALEERFQKLTREVPGGLFQVVFHADGGYTVPYLSEGVARITGYSFEEHLSRADVFNDCILEEDREGYNFSLRQCTQTLEPWNHEFRLRTKLGEEKWLRVMARPEASRGDVTWHGYVSDISEHKKQEMKIRELAYFDALTGLPNRRMFLDHMRQAKETCRKRRDNGVLLFIDLDNFKTLNDTQGHDVGDGFLVEIAERLCVCVTDADLVARIGGDEFVVVLEQPGADAAKATLRAINVANQILSSMREEFSLGSSRHVASASIGVVVFDGGEASADEILKRGDLAMYQAKAAGRDGVALFDPAMIGSLTEAPAIPLPLAGHLPEQHIPKGDGLSDTRRTAS